MINKILLTGGTGSFGQAMTPKLLGEEHHVIVYSRDELKQYEMAKEFNEYNYIFPRNCKLDFVIGDVRDQNRLANVCYQYKIDTIIHAAALKQVGVGEIHPSETIHTNIKGSQNITEVASALDLKKIILISSDKAVSPINLYGASKMCAEKLFLSSNHDKLHSMIVRYGNVVGSRGSVIPAFKEMAKTGTIKITHPDMTRFWITLDQATDLVLHALKEGMGGEIFIPKIPSMRITDLAQAIALEAKHEIVGIRLGEKLHEVLISPDEYFDVYENKDDQFYVIYTKNCHYGTSSTYKKYREIKDKFTYSSETNTEWLRIEQLKELIDG